MTSPWRMAGLNYVNYSNIAARVLRTSIKGGAKEDALKRSQSLIKCFFWVNGEMLPEGQKPTSSKTAKEP